MAFKKFGPVPFPPLLVLNADEPISEAWLAEQLAVSNGQRSFLIRTVVGAEKRGGFFFHLRQADEQLQFYDFGGIHIITLPRERAVCRTGTVAETKAAAMFGKLPA